MSKNASLISQIEKEYKKCPLGKAGGKGGLPKRRPLHNSIVRVEFIALNQHLVFAEELVSKGRSVFTRENPNRHKSLLWLLKILSASKLIDKGLFYR